MSVTPVSEKTMSFTSQKQAEQGPTPKNEFKKPSIQNKSYFMSPTDALVSPCTQRLRKIPRKHVVGNQRPRHFDGRSEFHVPSKLANKENEQKAPPKKLESLPEESTTTQPQETHV